MDVSAKLPAPCCRAAIQSVKCCGSLLPSPPTPAALIDFMGRLIRALKGRKVLLFLRPMTLLGDPGLKDWLAERIDSIELLILPS